MFTGERKMRQRLWLGICVVLLAILSMSLWIAWNQLSNNATPHLHLTYTTSNVWFNGTHMNVTIHFILPGNESFRCNGVKDRDGKVSPFTETRFYDGDSITLKFPALNISFGEKAQLWLLIVDDGDFLIKFDVPAS
jgi:hypothetical protein